jgi:hypothetical protein
MREATKAMLGSVVGTVDPRCRFDRSVFILAHMRCGSTALSNILCSRPEISGYGEAHIAYRTPSDLGRLVVNQALRGAWNPRARFLFDKVLHSRHDATVPPDFFRSRAIFLCRGPDATIPSIRRLFTRLARADYGTDTAAAEYYVERVTRLCDLWQAFPPERRLGFTYETLTTETERCLRGVSVLLGLDPALENSYRSHAASIRGGGGDPMASGRLDRIVAERRRPGDPTAHDISCALRRRAQEAYSRLVELIGLDAPAGWERADAGTSKARAEALAL